MTKRKCGGKIDRVEIRVEVKAKAEEVVGKGKGGAWGTVEDGKGADESGI